MDLSKIGETIIKESKRDSFYWGIWTVLAIFFVLQGGMTTVDNPIKSEYWACASCNNNGLGSPTWDNWQYRAIVKNITEANDCINLEIQRVNGQKIDGMYCVGDDIRVGNLVVKLKEIRPSVERPVLLEYYSVIDISIFIAFLLLAIPFLILYRKYKTDTEEKKKKEREVRKKEISKKMGISESEFDEIKDILKEEIGG